MISTLELKQLIKNEICKRWGENPIDNPQSDNELEKSDAHILMLLERLVPESMCKYSQTSTYRHYNGAWERSWHPGMPEYSEVTYIVCAGTPDLAPCPHDGNCALCERAKGAKKED